MFLLLAEAAAFRPHGFSHLLALSGTLLATAALFTLAATPSKLIAERTLGSILLALWPLAIVVHGLCGSLTVQTALPLQYCDVAAIAGGLALWTRRAFWAEVVYFFGIAGTLQGLLTPALIYDAPDPRFFHFFFMHGGVPLTSLYVVTAMRLPPRRDAVPRVFGFSVAWYAVAAVVNAVLGTNFAFQCQKPVQASLFDQLGEWPWYNFKAMAVGLVVYTLLMLPFLRRSKKA
jgi:hypothetical integral membrane protein (TIGR02206 family)